MKKRFSSIPSSPLLKVELPGLWSDREPILEELCTKQAFLRFNKIYTWCSGCKELAHRKTGYPAPDWVKEVMERFPKSHGLCSPCRERLFPRITPPHGFRRVVEEDVLREREAGPTVKKIVEEVVE